jgi:hypothetical protein
MSASFIPDYRANYALFIEGLQNAEGVWPLFLWSAGGVGKHMPFRPGGSGVVISIAENARPPL